MINSVSFGYSTAYARPNFGDAKPQKPADTKPDEKPPQADKPPSDNPLIDRMINYLSNVAIT